MRLQKRDISSQSWWAAKDSPGLPVVRDFDTRPETMICDACGHESCRVFRGVWMCLGKDCLQFWKVNGESPTTKLEYDPVFLSHRFFWGQDSLPESPDLVPTPPVITEENRDLWRHGENTRQGIVCPYCHKCVPRVFLNGWKCSVKHVVPPQPRKNELDCPWSLFVEGPIVRVCDVIAPPESLPEPRRNARDSGKQTEMPRGGLESFYKLPRFDSKCMRPQIDTVSLAPYVVLQYSLGDSIGTISHIVSNTVVNASKGGPDYLFHRFQELDLGLRRERLISARGMYQLLHNTHCVTNRKHSPRPDDWSFPEKYCKSESQILIVLHSR